MSYMQAFIMALLQGATELFPVSSLGHAVILPALLHWNYDLHDVSFLPFLVMLHLGTSVALLVFFFRDWRALFLGAVGRDGQRIQLESLHIFWLLIVATIPAVVVGGLFEHLLRSFFGSASSAAVFLFLNGLLLLLTERLRSSVVTREVRCIAGLTSRDAVVIGLFQCLAFFPGLSRSGATICGGLLRGLHHDAAARFSFLMAQLSLLPRPCARVSSCGMRRQMLGRSTLPWRQPLSPGLPRWPAPRFSCVISAVMTAGP